MSNNTELVNQWKSSPYFGGQSNPYDVAEDAWNASRQAQWISVEDRLPEKEDEYLIYPPEKYTGSIVSFWPYDDFREHSKNTFEYENDGGDVFQVYPTHWRLFPAPPEVTE